MNNSFAGKRVVVMGLGRFGGGVGAVRWLAEQSARVLVTDLACAADLADPLDAIRDLLDAGRVELRLGGHDTADFRGVDLVVVSPAVVKPWENPFILTAVESGARITTEIRLLVERLPRRGRVIGVTGTAGKSTTAAMIAHILRSVCAPAPQSPERKRGVAADPANGRDARSTDATNGRDARSTGGARVWLGGNIGGSLLPRAAEIGPDDWVVLELSSAMLYWLGDWFVGRTDEAGFSPHVAVVTNITPNHLDWHGDFAQYAACKANITAFQSSGDRVVGGDAGADGPRTINADKIEPLAVIGAHNHRNAALAVAGVTGALAARGVDDRGRAARALVTFSGLPHRLQRVAEAPRDHGVIRAFNDSKCTTPEAAALAVRAFDESSVNSGTGVSPVEKSVLPVYLIAGGYDKGVDLSPMIAEAARCRAVYTIGATGSTITRLVRDAGGRAEECSTLDRAVARALAAAGPGDVILLSPGCASWGQFTNYEERGRRFTNLVRAGLGLGPAPEPVFVMPAQV